MNDTMRGDSLPRTLISLVAAAGILIMIFILSMILEQAVLIGLLAYGLALALSMVLFPYFPRRVVLLPEDLALIFGGLLLACGLGSWIGIARAMRVRAKEVLA